MIRIAILITSLAGPAFAQTVTIRSGDHDSFARLVFAIPEGTAWEVGRIGGGIGVRLQDLPDGISIDGIFDRIPRNRIADATIDGDLVAIRLACDCYPDAFLWQSDRLVVDIVDGQSPSDNPYERQLVIGSDRIPVEEPLSVALPLLFSDRARHGNLEEVLPFNFQTFRAGQTVEDAQIAVVSSIARAATEGFFDLPIEPVQQMFAEDGAEDGGQPRVVGLAPVTDPMSELGNLLGREGSPGLVLRTALTDSITSDGEDSRETPACLPERVFDVPNWGDDRSFSEQISERRVALTHEFDRFPPGAIEELARTYIFFGFGIEARRVLTLDGALTAERLLLDELARVVDGADVPGGRLAQQVGCGGAAALWSILAAGTATDAEDVDQGEAIRAFRNLPKALREHLGPRFASLFIDAGVPERGQEILEYVNREDGLAPVEVELVRADLDAAAGEPSAQVERLDGLAEDNARMPSAALAELLELQTDLGGQPPVELIELGQVYLHEARPSGGDVALSAAVVRAWIARSEIEMAELVLEETVPPDSDMFRPLVNELLSAKASQLTDQEFLEFALADLNPLRGLQVEDQIAARLIELGFPQEALRFIPPGSDPDTELERRYLRASAQAQLGNVQSVEQELEGLQNNRARDIRIIALSQVEDFPAALEETLASENQEQTDELAWRAGDWEVLEMTEDELFQSVSRLAQQPTFLAPNLAELEARSALLEDAVRTREMAQDLLGRFSLDDSTRDTD